MFEVLPFKTETILSNSFKAAASQHQLQQLEYQLEAQGELK